MTQPATTTNRHSACTKDCDSCSKGKTCETLTPVLAQILPVQDSRPSEGASWK